MIRHGPNRTGAGPAGAGRRLIALVALLGLSTVVMASLSPSFLQAGTLQYILQFAPIVGLLGLGQTLIILAGGPGIDLSSGAIMSLCGLAIAGLWNLGVDPYAASLAGLALGLLLGSVNGALVTIVGIPALIATLATLFLFGGFAIAVTNGRPVAGLPESFGWLGQGTLFGLPNQLLFVFIPVAVALHVMLRHTRTGSHIIAVGNDHRAARLLGIRVVRLRFALFALNGGLAALAAVTNLSWFLAARPDAGRGLELAAVTVAVLGGTRIFGGEGSVAGPVVAVLIITVLQGGLQLANISPAWQLGVVGLLLIGSVIASDLPSILSTARRSG